jgi:hypothetical protein
MARAGNPESVEKDKDKVRDYVKEKLYERVIFVWKKSPLDQGGVFHRDYMSNCCSIIADGTLVNANDNEAKSYMNFLWAVMVKDNCYYQEWMCQKRSSRYQAIQDGFTSK